MTTTTTTITTTKKQIAELKKDARSWRSLAKQAMSKTAFNTFTAKAEECDRKIAELETIILSNV